MARALKVRLLKLKKAINSEKLKVEDELARVKAQQQKLESGLVSIAAQLKRAHEYGVVHSHENIFTCAPCFVQHDVLLSMRRTKAQVAGVKRYKCPRCGEELNSDELP